MLEDWLSGEGCKLIASISFIEWADSDARRFGPIQRFFKLSLVTNAQQNEMRVVKIGRVESSRFKSGMCGLHSNLGGRQVTANKDVNVTFAIIVVNLEHDFSFFEVRGI